MAQVRERALACFILKKQDFSEADQIITLFSQQEGKVRALVKAAKMPTSKLQPMLQLGFQTRVTLTGSKERAGLSKVIGVQMIANYSGIMESESKLAAWYVVSELLMRALPDGEPNENLFTELEKYAQFLHIPELEAHQVKQSVTQFQIKALRALGLGISSIPEMVLSTEGVQNIWFSLDRGGFTNVDSSDATPVLQRSFRAFQEILDGPYMLLDKSLEEDLKPISVLVNRFITYQLEREIKSNQLLANSFD